MEFENGIPAQITHNGYGYFMGAEMVTWGHANQRYTPEERVEVRRQMRDGTRNEAFDKQELRIGGGIWQQVFKQEYREPWVPEDLGIVIVSGDRGDLRHSQYGIFVYDDEGHTISSSSPTEQWAPPSGAPSWRSCTTPLCTASRCGMTGAGVWRRLRSAWRSSNLHASARR